jgi:hypothetical protein
VSVRCKGSQEASSAHILSPLMYAGVRGIHTTRSIHSVSGRCSWHCLLSCCKLMQRLSGVNFSLA